MGVLSRQSLVLSIVATARFPTAVNEKLASPLPEFEPLCDFRPDTLSSSGRRTSLRPRNIKKV